MSRFKELRRIEDAIRHNNPKELEWSKDYCALRLSLARLKTHKKHWFNLLKKVNLALEENNET